MCIAYQERHTTCDHRKAPVFIERCEDAQGDRCTSPDGIKIIWYKQVKQPSFCANCYRQQEEGIFEDYEPDITYLTHEIGLLKEKLEKATTETTRDLLRIRIAKHEKTRDVEIQQRTERLEEFREDQGVWGDG